MILMIRFAFILTLLIPLKVYSSLSILKAVEVYKSTDPTFQTLKLEEQKLDYMVDEALPTRALTMSFAGEKGFTSDSDLNTEVLSGEIEKDFIETGTSFSVAHTQTKRPDREENVTELRIEQSLYSNAFGGDTRILKTRLEEEKKLADLRVQESLDQYHASIIKKLLDYDRSVNAIELARYQRSEAEKLTQMVNEKRKSNIASDTDFKRSTLQVITSEKEILDKTKEREVILAELRAFSSQKQIDISLKKDATKEFIERIEKKISLTESDTHPANKVAKVSKDIAKKNIELANRLTRPDLRLVAGYNVDDSTRFGSQISREEKVLGLKFVIPFGDTKTKATKERVTIDALVQEASAKQVLRNYQWKVNELKVQIKDLKKRLSISDREVSLLRSILSDENRRYQIGRIDLENLIEVRSRFALARNQVAQVRLDYASLLIDWMVLHGELTDKLSLTKL